MNVNADSDSEQVKFKIKFYYFETLELSPKPMSSYLYHVSRRVPDVTKCRGFYDQLSVHKYWRIDRIRAALRRANQGTIHNNNNTLSAMPSPVIKTIENVGHITVAKAERHEDAKVRKINPKKQTMIIDTSCRLDDSIGSYSEKIDRPSDSWSSRFVRVSDNYMGYYLQIRDRSHPFIDTTKYELATELTIEYM